MANGLFGAPIGMQGTKLGGPYMPDTRPRPAPPEQAGGLFRQGGPARAIAGMIGDVLLQRGGLAPIYAPAMQLQRALADKQRAASLERETDWQDWVKREEWKRANPSQSDDAFDRALAGAGIDPNSEQGRALYRQRAEALANPVQWITGADGIPRPVARSVPTTPVGRLTPIEESTGSNAGGGFRP